MNPPVPLLLKKKLILKTRNRISNDIIRTQNSSDDMNHCFRELKHFRLKNLKKFNSRSSGH